MIGKVLERWRAWREERREKFWAMSKEEAQHTAGYILGEFGAVEAYVPMATRKQEKVLHDR